MHFLDLQHGVINHINIKGRIDPIRQIVFNIVVVCSLCSQDVASSICECSLEPCAYNQCFEQKYKKKITPPPTMNFSIFTAEKKSAYCIMSHSLFLSVVAFCP